MRRLFISDLHLGPETEDLNRAFRRWCLGPACEADEVWILGDLFEYWLGDDLGIEMYAPLIETLSVLGQNTPVHFIPGNRDFLCGRLFADSASLTIHEEPCVLRDDTAKIVLMHGDLLCTEDHDYLRYRRIVHLRWLQWLFLHTSRDFRAGIANRIRQKSQSRQHDATTMISDANPVAANDVLKKSATTILVHGHTHRPARHEHPNGLRYVLPDWRSGSPGSFGWLEQHNDSFCFRTLAGY